MSNQSQNSDGNAIQSGRDTTIVINQGVSAEELNGMLTLIQTVVQNQIALGLDVVKQRQADFEERLWKKINDSSSFDKEAFKDPDFLYMLQQAQLQSVRSGDAELAQCLIDLISRRSLEQGRNRLVLSLNDAISKAGILTRNEFAELTFCFLIRYSRFMSPNLTSLGKKFNELVIPLLDDISREPTSYSYMESHSCARVDSLLVFEMAELFRNSYWGLITAGFEKDQLVNTLPDAKKTVLDNLLIPCLRNPAKVQLNILGLHELEYEARERGLEQSDVTRIWNTIGSTAGDEAMIISTLEKSVPEAARMFQLWGSTPMSKLSLTSVGIALAYANLMRLGHKVDLTIWIK